MKRKKITFKIGIISFCYLSLYACSNKSTQTQIRVKALPLQKFLNTNIHYYPADTNMILHIQNVFEFKIIGVSESNDTIYKYVPKKTNSNHIYYIKNSNKIPKSIILKYRYKDTLLTGLFLLDKYYNTIKAISVYYKEQRTCLSNIKYSDKNLLYCAQNLDSLQSSKILKELNANNFATLYNVLNFPECYKYSDYTDPYYNLDPGSVWLEW
jgi:hypothetical protein